MQRALDTTVLDKAVRQLGAPVRAKVVERMQLVPLPEHSNCYAACKDWPYGAIRKIVGLANVMPDKVFRGCRLCLQWGTFDR